MENNMVTVMGIDQSLTCTGVVVLDIMPHLGERSPLIEVDYSGSIKTVKGEDDFIFDTLTRGNHIVEELLEIAQDHGVDVICFETPSLASKGNATRTLPMLLGMILKGLNEVVKQRGIEMYHVAPKSLKKIATGSGNAGKEEMFNQLQIDCPELYNDLLGKPKNVGRYDITDAYYLAKQGYSLHIQSEISN